MQMIESNHVDLQPYLTCNFVGFERSENFRVSNFADYCLKKQKKKKKEKKGNEKKPNT